jgi:hypothetical protein
MRKARAESVAGTPAGTLTTAARADRFLHR